MPSPSRSIYKVSAPSSTVKLVLRLETSRTVNVGGLEYIGDRRDCSAAGAGAKRSLARPPPRGGLVTSAILSVRRATAVYTNSTFWQRRQRRLLSERVFSRRCPLTAERSRRCLSRDTATDCNVSLGVSRVRRVAGYISDEKVTRPVCELTRTGCVSVTLRGSRYTRTETVRLRSSFLMITATSARRTVGSHAVNALAGGTIIHEGADT
ncbi:uncharacterized protein LOC143154793 [Ptiloglossa arizonensis]|uniref:uncharacterized protein LOC143154793 n=1 Tax=Ptiloglossa arizonensis TaxID=3350558 RepID=UPI003FA010CE